MIKAGFVIGSGNPWYVVDYSAIIHCLKTRVSQRRAAHEPDLVEPQVHVKESAAMGDTAQGALRCES